MHAADELARNGEATVACADGEGAHQVSVDDEVSFYLQDQQRHDTARVGDLIAYCTTPRAEDENRLRLIPPSEQAQCPLNIERVFSSEAVDMSATFERIGTTALQVGGVLALSALVIAPGYCAFECDAPWNHVGSVVLAVESLALGALITLGIYELTHWRKGR
jgi:hypothetical protein